MNLPKDEKEFTAEEFKRWFRGARLKTKNDYIEIRHYLDRKIQEWNWYWNCGIDGRDK